MVQVVFNNYEKNLIFLWLNNKDCCNNIWLERFCLPISEGENFIVTLKKKKEKTCEVDKFSVRQPKEVTHEKKVLPVWKCAQGPEQDRTGDRINLTWKHVILHNMWCICILFSTINDCRLIGRWWIQPPFYALALSLDLKWHLKKYRTLVSN